MAKTQKQVIGRIGENCAATYLQRHGYKILEQNYRKPYGEIDIIATKARNLHFIEVKSVSRVPSTDSTQHGSREPLCRADQKLSRESRGRSSDHVDGWEAEENVHPWKLKRLARTIEAYLLAKYPGDDDEEPDWQLDVITVYVDMAKREGRVKLISDIDIA